MNTELIKPNLRRMKYSRISLLFLLTCFATSSLWSQNGSKQITFDDFFKNYTFRAKGIPNFQSLKDGKTYLSSDNNGNLIAKNFADGKTARTLLNLNKISNCPIKNYDDIAFSDDEKKILLQTQTEEVYRRSFTATYYIYDTEKNTITPLSPKPKQQLATFSPDGNKVAFVRENNLFYVDLNNGKETQITTDGKFNEIINGLPDWVYEEEFEFNKAFAWSADSRNLAWIRFDESKVPQFSMNMFQGMAPSIEANKLYPGVSTFKYPKAGEPNSIVNVYNYNITTNKKTTFDIGSETDIYIPRIFYTPDANKLAIFRLNRHQNHFEILIGNPETGATATLYDETNKYYIDEKNFDNIKFLNDKKHFVILSEKDGYSHIYLYNMDGKLVNQITKGEYDVLDINGYNEADKIIYYTSAQPTPYQKEVYAIGFDGKNKNKLSLTNGTNGILFSSDYSYYILSHSDSKTPASYTLFDKNNKKIRVLEDNSTLINKLKDYNFSYREFINFTTASGVNLYGWMLKPANFDPNKKYPVFMTQYSGPNSQSALDRWEFGWENYLAQLGYIVVCVDGRGTGSRGEAFRKVTYMQLGKYETIDQIETAKYLSTLPYVDGGRIGIWGWSFGGYISSSCMVKGNGMFKMAIAVAPVTNWRYYDNIYTERFMRTPQENAEGYDQNSPLNFAKDFNGKLLLCHGTADDNVHVQNTYEFAERLVQANKQFEMQIYTNRNHSIYGGNTRYHLYTRFLDFIKKNL